MSQQDAAASNMDSGGSVETKEAAPKESPRRTRKGPRFWAIMVVLALTGLPKALEAIIASTILPVIVADLGGGDSYIWVVNA
ncbi:hypothetical protein DL771_003329 [Monosporascus sp. 5C6A]|nr:hypothetical protein DL771_003329 [Monosporascus sp. 5C6A]